MIAVFKREISAVFHHFLGYVYLAAFTFLSGVMVWILNLSSNGSPFEYSAIWFAFFMTALLPLCYFPSVYREKKYGMDRVLYGLPISDASICCGKFLACFTVPFCGLILILLWALILLGLHSLHVAVTFSVLLALLGICLFYSAVCFLLAWTFENRWISLAVYEVTVAFTIVVYLIYKSVPAFVSAFSPFTFLHNVIIGSFDWIWLILLLILTCAIVFLTVFGIARKRKEFEDETNF